MAKFLRSGLVALRYIGKIKKPFRAAVEERKYPEVSPGDIILVDAAKAVRLKRGTEYEEVETPHDLSVLFEGAKGEDVLEFVDDDVLMAELIQRGILDAPVEAEADPDKEEAAAEAKAEQEAKEKAEAAADPKTKAAAEADTDPAPAEKVLTRANIMDEDVTVKMIKTACKAHKVTIGNNKKEDLIALLLPFLPEA